MKANRPAAINVRRVLNITVALGAKKICLDVPMFTAIR
jgi:cadmium resistance protein CadD (predicted permease)